MDEYKALIQRPNMQFSPGLRNYFFWQEIIRTLGMNFCGKCSKPVVNYFLFNFRFYISFGLSRLNTLKKNFWTPDICQLLLCEFRIRSKRKYGMLSIFWDIEQSSATVSSYYWQTSLYHTFNKLWSRTRYNTCMAKITDSSLCFYGYYFQHNNIQYFLEYAIKNRFRL